MTGPELVAAIVKACAAELRVAKFKKRGQTFYRVFDRGLQLLTFQSSRWNSYSSAQFTINLCAHYPGLLALDVDRPKLPLPAWPPAKIEIPGLGYRHNTRIGQIMLERRDYWWKVEAESDISTVTAHVTATITEFGIPWLERNSDLGWLAAYYRPFSPRAAARCYVLAGNLAAARDALLEWSRDANLSPEAIANGLAWGRHVGIAV